MHQQTLITATTLAVANSLSLKIIQNLIGQNVASTLGGAPLDEPALVDLTNNCLQNALPALKTFDNI